MKKLNVTQMENLQGGLGGSDCAMSVVASVGITLSMIGLLTISGGALTPLMLGLWGGAKALSYGAIGANCAD